MPWKRRRLVDEVRTWITNSAASFRCRICERAKVGSCRFAWRASVSSSRIARYDSHIRIKVAHSSYGCDYGARRIESSVLSLSLPRGLCKLIYKYIYIYIVLLYFTSNCLCHVEPHLTSYIYLFRTLIWWLLSSFARYITPYFDYIYNVSSLVNAIFLLFLSQCV